MHPGPAIRVLVVDDSVVMRQIISDALRGDPRVEVVGTAQDGRIGLQKIVELKPDVVTLDLEMPELDGLGVLDELKARGLQLPVVLFSTLSEHGARITLDALAKGASDYVAKPTKQRGMTATIDLIRSELVARICAVYKAKRASYRPGVALVTPSKPAPMPDTPLGKIDVLAIGVSTGGPAALAEIIPRLPSALGLPVLIVQHMPPVFTKVMADRLASVSALRVCEAKHGEAVEPNTVYVAPGDFHMRVTGRSSIALDQSPLQNGTRPSVDVMFESVAASFGHGVLALVLTGLGQDGMRGAGAVRRAGGHVWVQDDASCIAHGMPAAVVGAGLANRIVPLSGMATAIANAVQRTGR